MVDIETMGLAPDGAVASIGAVKFDPHGVGVGEKFYTNVQIDGQEKFGRQITGSTVMWWLTQSEDARKALRGQELLLPAALRKFAEFVGSKSIPSWAYGATFDHVILQRAYDAVNEKNSIHYRDQLCMRGLAKLWGNCEPPEKVGTAHNALDDAVFQALWLQKILCAIR